MTTVSLDNLSVVAVAAVVLAVVVIVVVAVVVVVLILLLLLRSKQICLATQTKYKPYCNVAVAVAATTFQRYNFSVVAMVAVVFAQGSANQPLINRESLLLLSIAAVVCCSSFACQLSIDQLNTDFCNKAAVNRRVKSCATANKAVLSLKSHPKHCVQRPAKH